MIASGIHFGIKNLLDGMNVGEYNLYRQVNEPDM